MDQFYGDGVDFCGRSLHGDTNIYIYIYNGQLLPIESYENQIYSYTDVSVISKKE